jgi:hypothetical protein
MCPWFLTTTLAALGAGYLQHGFHKPLISLTARMPRRERSEVSSFSTQPTPFIIITSFTSVGELPRLYREPLGFAHPIVGVFSGGGCTGVSKDDDLFNL